MSGTTCQFGCRGLLRGLCLLLFSFVLCITFAFFIFMIIFQPQELKFTVNGVSLEEFNLTKSDDDNNNNNSLSYSFAINITIRNPNRKVGVYFDQIKAIANYGKIRFSTVRFNSTAPFYQGHKNTTILRAVFKGQQFITFEDQSENDDRYESETSSGIYSIDAKIDLRMRSRYGMIRTGHFKHPKTIDCKLKVPLRSNGTYSASSHNFEATRCYHV